MKYFGVCPGSCGEFVQGILGKDEYLASYAVNLYSKATIEEKKDNISKGPYKSRKAIEEVCKYFNIDIRYTKNLSLKVQSNIPRGKGMASSTADIGATIKATLNYLGKNISLQQISKIATNIEPTDSILIKQVSIFNPLNGEIIKTLGFIEGMRVLVLEPDETLNTIKLRSKGDYYLIKEKNKDGISEAFKLLEEGFKNKSLKLIGQASNLSSIMNQVIHQKEGLKEVMNISKEFGAYGVNVAHSGTVIGIILDKEMDWKKLKDELILNNLDKKYKRIYPLDIVKGGVYNERFDNTSSWKQNK
ncbi:GHMP family kinase ATP-binding protein [Alkalithermobacter paradoxus]|uniref:L-threonine kinase n=1 Tax=Alkalithermobacter paradoxus TaxID=29349 RepID=A0A1V4I7Q4_9FIRM|nr:L-threonine kinase [[Clostridium] thermoalcaliphilum]